MRPHILIVSTLLVVGVAAYASSTDIVRTVQTYVTTTQKPVVAREIADVRTALPAKPGILSAVSAHPILLLKTEKLQLMTPGVAVAVKSVPAPAVPAYLAVPSLPTVPVAAPPPLAVKASGPAPAIPVATSSFATALAPKPVMPTPAKAPAPPAPTVPAQVAPAASGGVGNAVQVRRPAAPQLQGVPATSLVDRSLRGNGKAYIDQIQLPPISQGAQAARVDLLAHAQQGNGENYDLSQFEKYGSPDYARVVEGDDGSMKVEKPSAPAPSQSAPAPDAAPVPGN